MQRALPWLEIVGALFLVLAFATVGSRIWVAANVGADITSIEAMTPYMPGLLAGQAVLTGVAGWLLAWRRLGRAERKPRVRIDRAMLAGVGAGTLAFAVSFALGALQSWLGAPVEEQEIIVAILDDPLTKLRALP